MRDFFESFDEAGELSEACVDVGPAVMRSLVDAESEERRSGGCGFGEVSMGMVPY